MNSHMGSTGHGDINGNDSQSTNCNDSDTLNQCSQCKKTFSTKQTLSIHMKTAKYCLEKKSKKAFECEYCGKRLSSKQMMLYHDDICPMKRQYMFDKRIEQIQSMMLTNTHHALTTPSTGDDDNTPPCSLSQSTSTSTDKVVTSLPKTLSSDSRSFCHMNVMVHCQLLSTYAKNPTKKDSLVYQVYPCIERSLVLEASTSMTISTGLSLSIPMGWHAILMNCDALHDDVLVVQEMFDSRSSKEVQVRIYNMMNRCITVEPDQPIAQLVFHKYVDTFNVHVNCKSHNMLT